MSEIKHISYSAVKDWQKCAHYFKLSRIDKIKLFRGNIYTAFGTAVHDVCEELLCNENVDYDKYFDESFKKQLVGLPEDIRSNMIAKHITDMRQQGKMLAPMILPSLKQEFEGYELVKTEEEIYESLADIFPEHEYFFKGFIDLVIKTPDGRTHIIDWKTCSWGWNWAKKADKMIYYQLILYKHFYAKKHDVDISTIDTYFALLKRTAKKDNVEMYRVSSGKVKNRNVIKLLTTALHNIHSGRYIKNRLSCQGCEYYKTEHCT